MHDVFEIGFRQLLELQAIKECLASYFEIDVNAIIDEDDYWSDAWTGKARVGISVQFKPEGLKTNLSGVAFQRLDDEDLEGMAKLAAKVLCSEAVIGDFRKSGRDAIGRFLVYFPDGAVWEAVDSSRGPVDNVNLLGKI